MALEKTLESPLDCKEIKPVDPKGNQSWIFVGRTDAEAPILWPPNVKSWFIGKEPDAGKDWGQEVKWVTEDEMVGWRHQVNGHEFEQTLGDSEGQGSLACCSTWGLKESDIETEQQQPRLSRRPILLGRSFSHGWVIMYVCSGKLLSGFFSFLGPRCNQLSQPCKIQVLDF